MARGQKPLPIPILDRASRGLSVSLTLKCARGHARENKSLGSIIVRYVFPDDAAFTLEQLVGDKDCHYTLFMDDLTALAEFLDHGWWEVQDFTSETAG